jgi:hypothetical protein
VSVLIFFLNLGNKTRAFVVNTLRREELIVNLINYISKAIITFSKLFVPFLNERQYVYEPFDLIESFICLYFSFYC